LIRRGVFEVETVEVSTFFCPAPILVLEQKSPPPKKTATEDTESTEKRNK
jgi:hypothetical protein